MRTLKLAHLAKVAGRALLGIGGALSAALISSCTPVEATLPLVRIPDAQIAKMALGPDEMLAWELSRGCETKVAEDCHALGDLYFVGEGVPRIPAHAIALWDHACHRGVAPACSELARQRELGRSVPRDLPVALDARERACRLGSAPDCTEVGAYHRDGRLGTARPRRAQRWFRRGCDGGDDRGCHEVAIASLRDADDPNEFQEVVVRLDELCDREHAPSCVQLSVLYAGGRGIEANPQAVRAYQERACDAGEGGVCTALGVGMLAMATTDPATMVRASEWFTAACDLGHPQGCGLLGRAYELGQGVTEDRERAFELYAIGCRGGAAEACGRALVLGEVSVDGAALRDLYSVACGAGHMDACHFLAGLLVDGVGGPIDHQAAAVLYERACNHDVAASCIDFAFMAAATENARPFGWLQRACDVDEQACAVLGEIHEGGFWGKPEPELAAELYARACAGDSARACFRLGTLHYRGEGVSQDAAAAARLMLVACDGGEADACATLAHMHDRGIGRQRSAASAQHYRTRACELGSEVSCDLQR